MSASNNKLNWRKDLNAEVEWEGAFGTKVWHVDRVSSFSRNMEIFPGKYIEVNAAYRACVYSFKRGNAKAIAAVMMCSEDKVLQEYLRGERT